MGISPELNQKYQSLLDRLLVSFKDPCNPYGPGRATHFAGLATGALVFVNHHDIPRLDAHNDFIIRGMPAGTHLGISYLIHRAGGAAVPAARAEVSVDSNAEREEQ